MDPNHVAWCRKMFDQLRDGGSWGVPRSGLIFQKRGEALVLAMRMPHDPVMPVTPEQLTAQQDSDYEETVRHFAAAGITVRSEV